MVHKAPMTIHQRPPQIEKASHPDFAPDRLFRVVAALQAVKRLTFPDSANPET
jgi:hypothetical protein